MKKVLSILSVLLFIVTFQACKSDDAVQAPAVDSKYYTTAQNDIVILKDDAIQYIQEKVETDSLIVFSNSAPDEVIPQVGTKIFIPVSEKTPYGFLGKVTSVEKANPIKVFTEALPLEEAFESLSVDTTLNIMDKIEGVYDADGNEVEYEIIDSTLTDASTSSQAKGTATRAYLYGRNGIIKFPIAIAEKETGKENFSNELNGEILIELNDFDFDIDVVNNEIKYIDFKVNPTMKISLKDEMTIETPKEKDHSKLLGVVNIAPITIPTPIPFLPVILRPKLYVYAVWGYKGEITASLGLQYQCSAKAEMHYRNGNWDNLFHGNGYKNENPWTVSEFNVEGELFAGLKLGALVGLYSATTGIGLDIIPKGCLSAEAKLSTDNLLDINPQVEVAAKIEGDLYLTAPLSFFKHNLEHTPIFNPEYVLWSEKMYLLPQFNEFTAIGSSSSGEISYQIDSHYFLSLLGVKTGAKVYESDKKTEFNTYYTSPTNTDNKGNKYYNLDVTGLSAGKTYYASPVCSWLRFTWPMSKKYEFTTEASYRIYWRCEGREDIWNIDFNVNSSTTSLNMPFEAATYNNGKTKRLLQATYDPQTGLLTGTVETNFYDNPDDRRIDGFSADLKLDDTGYMTNTKVLDNGACYTQIRFVKLGTAGMPKAMKKISKGTDECGLGEHL